MEFEESFDVQNSLAERLSRLSMDQVDVLEGLSSGQTKLEAAQSRGVRLKEIGSMIQGVEDLLGTSTHGAVYILLEERIIAVSDEEKAAAGLVAAALNKRLAAILSMFMAGATYAEAAAATGYSENTMQDFLKQINKSLGTHSLPQAVRAGYAAGLRPGGFEIPKRPQPEAMPVAPEHVRQFLSWMFYQRPPADFAGLTDDILRAMPSVLAGELSEAVKVQKNKAAVLKTAREYTREWWAGETIPQMAAKRGRQEGSIVMALDSLARKLGANLDLEDVIDKATRTAQKRARQLGRAAAESASDIVTIELPAEAIEELGETAAEATVAKETPVEAPEPATATEPQPAPEPEPEPEPIAEPAPEPPAETKPPLSKYQRKQRLKRPVHQYSDDFRLADRLSPSAREALEEMIKKAGIPPSDQSPRKPDQRRRN